jgi:hypothetical protein
VDPGGATSRASVDAVSANVRVSAYTGGRARLSRAGRRPARDGDDELAWQTATTLPGPDLGERAWLRLAEARQQSDPAQALPVYWRLIDSTLETADRRAYAAAVRLLKRARDAATAGGEVEAFEARLLALRDRHRRR